MVDTARNVSKLLDGMIKKNEMILENITDFPTDVKDVVNRVVNNMSLSKNSFDTQEHREYNSRRNRRGGGYYHGRERWRR